MIHNSNFQSFYIIELCPVFVDTAKCLFFHIARFYFQSEVVSPNICHIPFGVEFNFAKFALYALPLEETISTLRKSKKFSASFIRILEYMVSNIFELSPFNTFLSYYYRIPAKSQICGISRWYEVPLRKRDYGNITFKRNYTLPTD